MTCAVLLVGLWLFGTGEAALIDARLGNSPWTVLAEGVARHTPLSIGGATFAISVLILLGWIPLRERPGLGTVSNIIVISIAIDVMLPLLPGPERLGPRLAEVAIGVALIGLGSGLYLTTALGPGPRDGWMTGISRRTGLPLAVTRTGLEATALIIGWLLGGRVGAGTALFAVLVGPALVGTLRVLVAAVPPAAPTAESPA